MAPKQQYQKKTSAQILDGINSVKAVSSTINIGRNLIADPEEKSDRIKARIMKRAALELPEIREIKAPVLEEIAGAQKDAGVSLVSVKSKRAHFMERANAKRSLQLRLADKHDLDLEYSKDELDAKAEELKDMDPASLLYPESGRSADETLIERYSELQGIFLAIDNYEETLRQRQEEGIPEEEASDYAAEIAQLNTLKDIRSYYAVMDALVSNKYYTMLPREHMLSRSYDELRKKLDEVSSRKEPDASLIDYYQNLIRLKQLGLTDTKSIEARKEMYLEKLTRVKKDEDKRDGAKEMKKISVGYRAMMDMLKNRSAFYTDDEKTAYKDQFFMTHHDDLEKFKASAAAGDKDMAEMLRDYNTYLGTGEQAVEETTALYVAGKVQGDANKLEKRKDPPAGIGLNDEQRAAMRRVGAYLMRRSCLDKRKKGAFIHHLLQAPPEQQLMVFYLLETGRTDTYMRSDFYSALSGYVPDLKAIKKNVKTGWFTSSPNWRMIDSALQASKSVSADMAEYARLENSITTGGNELDNNEEAAKQGQRILDLIEDRYSMLALLYRNAGLHPDMSPDMVNDEKLRNRMYSELGKIVSLSERLKELMRENPDLIAAQPEKVKTGTKDSYKAHESKGAETTNNVISTFDTVLSYPKTVRKSVKDLFSYDDTNSVSQFMKRTDMQYINAGMGTLSALFDYYTNIYGMVKLAGKSGLTTADKTAQWMSKVSGLVGAMRGTGSTTIDYLKAAEVVTKTTDGVQPATDAFSVIGIVTSTVSAVSSGIQLGRAISSAKDIGRSRDKLNAKKLGRPGVDKLTPDEKTLERFLNHSKKDMKRQIVSKSLATVKSVAHIVTSTAGLVPVIAPVTAAAGFVLFAISEVGKVVERKRRNGIIKEAVDEQLGLKSIIADLRRDRKNNDALKGVKDDKLTDMLREEAVAQFGYSSYKTYFREVCREFAELLYRKVFEEDPVEEMYLDAMKSLGTKIKKGVDGKPNKPSIKTMIAKLMG